MRLVIADDEVNVRDGLVSLVHDVAPDVRVVGLAKSVAEVTQLVRIQKPELVFIDIRMPGGTGLDAVASGGGDPLPLWIVITSYPEFDYARRAISLDVFEYLLKPVSSQEMRGVLNSARPIVARRIRETTPSSAATAGPHSEIPTQDIALLAKAHMDEQFNLPIGVGQIAEQLGLSANYLSTMFRERHGESPLRYLTRLRMQEARRLILSGYRVKEVAGLVGFQDIRYFSRLFARFWGASPGQYAKTHTASGTP